MKKISVALIAGVAAVQLWFLMPAWELSPQILLATFLLLTSSALHFDAEV